MSITTTKYCDNRLIALRDAAIAEVNQFTGMRERETIAYLLLAYFPVSLGGFEPPSKHDPCWHGEGEAEFSTRLVCDGIDLWVSVVVSELEQGEAVDQHDMKVLVERLDRTMILVETSTT